MNSCHLLLIAGYLFLLNESQEREVWTRKTLEDGAQTDTYIYWMAASNRKYAPHGPLSLHYLTSTIVIGASSLLES